VRAALSAPARFEAATRLGTDDVDDATDCLAAVQRRLRTAQNLDAGGVADEEVAKVVAAAREGRIVHEDAIDDHDRVVTLGTADEDRGRLADPAGACRVDPRSLGEQIGQHHRLTGPDSRRIEHGDRVADRGQRLGGSVGDHDDLVQTSLGARGRRLRACGVA